MTTVAIYDTTLRDGTQREGISLSVADKIRITKLLDDLGVAYIEGGWPGSDLKDATDFEIVRSLQLRHARFAAFSNTCRKGSRPEDDAHIQKLVSAHAPLCTILGTMSMLPVTDLLQTKPEENLRMIEDTVRYLKGLGKEVIYDAEHFFDGLKLDLEYGMDTVAAAVRGGADCVVLCDTNGGALPWEVTQYF